jgi:hypothetical protein
MSNHLATAFRRGPVVLFAGEDQGRGGQRHQRKADRVIGDRGLKALGEILRRHIAVDRVERGIAPHRLAEDGDPRRIDKLVLDGLGDPSVLALSGRIAGVARDSRPKRSLSITVRRTDGRSVTVEASDPTGSPEKPLTESQFEAKFRDCARNALRRLSDTPVDAVLASIRRLETLADARELLTAFAE